MKAIPRYLPPPLVAATLAVTAVLILAVRPIRSPRFIDRIVERGPRHRFAPTMGAKGGAAVSALP